MAFKSFEEGLLCLLVLKLRFFIAGVKIISLMVVVVLLDIILSF
jgi:hypothetical protein